MFFVVSIMYCMNTHVYFRITFTFLIFKNMLSKLIYFIVIRDTYERYGNLVQQYQPIA